MFILVSCDYKKDDMKSLSLDCSTVTKIEFEITNVYVENRNSMRVQVVESDVFSIDKEFFCAVTEIINKNKINTNTKYQLYGALRIYTETSRYNFVLSRNTVITDSTNNITYNIDGAQLMKLLNRNKRFIMKKIISETPMKPL